MNFIALIFTTKTLRTQIDTEKILSAPKCP